MSSSVIVDLPTTETWMKSIHDMQETLKLTNRDVHAVFYTDGGCRPPPRGIGGWGVHGYLYGIEQQNKGYGLKGFIPTPSGYKVSNEGHKDPAAVTIIQYVDGVGNKCPNSTNNESEVLALLNILKWVLELKLKTVHFLLDSEYVLDGVRGDMYKWARNNWRRADSQPIANAEAWKILHDVLLRVSDATVVTWSWVKGHSGNLGNETADEWATAGINAGHNGLQLTRIQYSSPTKYWTPENNYHRFFLESYWYFNAQPIKRYGDQYVYHLGNHGKDLSDFGKPKAESNMVVVFVPQQDQALAAVHKAQQRIDEGLGSVVAGHLGAIMRPASYPKLVSHGDMFLRCESEKANVLDAEKRCLTEEMRPTFQAFRGAEELETLEYWLRNYKDNVLRHDARLTDITELLYEEVEVKKKKDVKLKLSSDETSVLPIEVTYFSQLANGDKKASVVLSTGIDLPKRNTLLAIASPTTKAYVITWPSSCAGAFDAFHYATIIDTDNGCGIWAGVYSNLRIVL